MEKRKKKAKEEVTIVPRNLEYNKGIYLVIMPTKVSYNTSFHVH